MDEQAHVKAGLSDAEFATHPTVYAADALKDQVAVVSGGAGGIGRAIAWLFARLGAHVVVVGRNQAKLDALVDDLSAPEPEGNSRGRRHPAARRRQRPVRPGLGGRSAASTSSSTAPADNFRNPRSIFP